MDTGHADLGRVLDLFDTTPAVGAGLPLRLPDGAVVRAELERLALEQALASGCRRVYTPVLGKRELFERSGHREDQLREALDAAGLAFEVAPGEAASHGPKIDVQVTDRGGRAETLSTVQVDHDQPERLGLSCTGEDGRRHRPVMVHRGLLSSMERLTAILVQASAGRLPTWLAPVQVRVLPVGDQRHAGPPGSSRTS
jgi:threonyl-tRNA synthetase